MKTILLMRHSIPEKSSKFVTDPGLSPIVYNMEELRKVLTYDRLFECCTDFLTCDKQKKSESASGKPVRIFFVLWVKSS